MDFIFNAERIRNAEKLLKVAADLWRKIAGGRPAGVVAAAAYYALYPLAVVLWTVVSLVYDEKYSEIWATGWTGAYHILAAAIWAAAFVWYILMCLCGINLYRMKNWARRGVRFFAAVHICLLIIGIILLIFLPGNEAIAEEPPLFDLTEIIFLVVWLVDIAIWIYLGRAEIVARFIYADGKTAETFLAQKIAEKDSETSAKSSSPE